jgi:hypothetical protein
LVLKQTSSLAVKASRLPPIESTERAISSAERLGGALEQHVLDEVRDAVLLGFSRREPVPIQMPTEMERTCGMTSVITRTPLGQRGHFDVPIREAGHEGHRLDGLPGHRAGAGADRDHRPLRNQNGPNQDIIVAKMLGKAKITNVAGGMSGSPVYIDGKLVGAVALRMSTFSPDAICGITPIELMLEINDLDKSRPEDATRRTRRARRNGAVRSVPTCWAIWPPGSARRCLRP